MQPFYYEIFHTHRGHTSADRLCTLIADDRLLSHASRPWQHAHLPSSADLYALIVVVTDDIAADPVWRRRITEIEAHGFPVIPVVESVATYDFKRAPHPALSRRNAVGLDDPDALLAALYQHGGLRRHGSGGHVMISYARVDGSDLADAVRLGLVAAGFHTFMDIHEVAGGAAIQVEIKRAIEGADLVLLVDSQGAAASPWVALEIDMARAAHVPILAVTREREGYHPLRTPHVPWPESGLLADIADNAVSAARRRLAQKSSFRARVARTIEQLATLRGWALHEVPPEWLVHPHDAGVRVACLDDHPHSGDVVRFRKRLGLAHGILVAGTRPYPPDEAEAMRDLGRDRVRVTPLGQVASALADRAASGSLRGLRVFLSAAMPDEAQSEAAAHTLAPFIITFIQSMFSLGVTVVFGGHPSITPMVHRAIVEIAAEDSGTI
ncbi:MAG TPA: toll/interleukin-1 receptor domain-containing protein, partial [Nannocystaceae bacterium]|nr:toll/interleukin-1 receptor domain-containing protein [Nannocystaceae bacterium]